MMNKDKLYSYLTITHEIKVIGRNNGMSLHETMMMFQIGDRTTTVAEMLQEIDNCLDNEEEKNYAKIFATKVIKNLEEKGFLERQRSKKDRRMIEIKFTPKGREFFLSNFEQN